MNLLGRRQFCLCLASLPVAFEDSAEREATHTCGLSFDAQQSSVDKSTIKPLDFAKQNYANGLVMILDDLTTYLGINLELFTYYDGESPNAAFTRDLTYRPPSWTGAATATDGIILLGENLIKEMEAYFGTLGAPLTALCAHEAGHALQAKYNLGNWKSYTTNPEDDHHQDRYELCADFICGYAAWHRQTIDSGYPAGLQATTQSSPCIR
ncbi:hypothetical protein [Pararhizobium sp. DWP3-4]|uniref:hypothetical protein n=1 Tax=Pararhizobium sp. DWP3-4 TaxID=2804565 RepID=UPI003CF81964